MSRSSASEASLVRDRRATLPLAALIAVTAVAAGVGLYATALADARPGSGDAPTATAAGRIATEASSTGVLDPTALPAAREAGPAGYRVRTVLVVDDERWASGPTPPPSTPSVTTWVSVQTAPTEVRPGRLEVWVW